MCYLSLSLDQRINWKSWAGKFSMDIVTREWDVDFLHCAELMASEPARVISDRTLKRWAKRIVG